MSYIETADDLSKKYHNTFVKYKNKPVYVHHFEYLANNAITFKAQAGDRVVLSCVLEKHEDIEPIYFDATFINNTVFNKDAENPAVPLVLVQRKPRRQWKRGICKDNTSVSCPLEPLYKSFSKAMVPWHSDLDLQLVRRLIAPTYPSYNESLVLCKRYQGVAFCPMFAVTLSSVHKEKFLLVSHFGFIGEAVKDHVIVRHPAALQEVRDYFSRSMQNVAVELG